MFKTTEGGGGSGGRALIVLPQSGSQVPTPADGRDPPPNVLVGTGGGGEGGAWGVP